MSIYKYSLLACLVVVTSHAVQAGECENHCNTYRPKGTDGPYTLDCNKISGNRSQCGSKCESCKNICFGGSAPENKTFRCGPSSPPKAKAREFDDDWERRHNSRRDEIFEGAVIFYIIGGVILLLCITVPACIFCCVQANRNRYPNVPMMHAPGAVYPTATYAPVQTMYGGGAVMTTTAYPNQVAKSRGPTVEATAEIGGGGSSSSI